jgi:hypothetical protein
VAGELAGDCDGDDRSALAASLEVPPATVELLGDRLCLGADEGGLSGPSAIEGDACAERSPLVPGRFDEQSAGVAVAGLGDPTLAALLAA